MIYAIIPARSGSKGVPHKNIRLLHGHPLLAWSIAAAKLCTKIDRIIVSTDSEEYVAIAKQYGAEAPFIRPAQFASDTSTDRDVLLHVLTWFKEHEGHIPDTFVHLRPTTPLREPALVSDAIVKFMASKGVSSLRSAHEAPESPAKWFSLKNGKFSGLMGNECLNMPRQQCPKAYIPNGYVDIVSSVDILERKDVYLPELLAFITPVTYEVDTLEELKYIEYIAKDHCLLKWLDVQK